MKILISVFILILTVACNSQSESNRDIETVVVIDSANTSPKPTTANREAIATIDDDLLTPTRISPGEIAVETIQSPTPTVSSTVEKPLITPDIIEFCPSEREILFGNLNLPNSTALIVQSSANPENGFSLMSNDGTIRPISNTTSSDDHFVLFKGISPNGQWFAFYRWKRESELADLWISSIDGQQQWIATQVDLRTQYDTGWFSEEELVITNPIPLSGQIEQAIPIELFNPFTKESRSLNSLPVGVRPFAKGPFPTDSGGIFGVYLSRLVWLYDYNSGEGYPILTWLEEQEELYADPTVNFYNNIILSIGNNGLADIFVEQPYGLDMGLSIEPLNVSPKSYQEVMQKISLSSAEFNTELLRWMPINKLLVYEQSAQQSDERYFYVLDVEELKVQDYCLDRGDTLSPRPSFDEKFLIWSQPGNSPGQQPQDTIILEVATGRTARLDGFIVLGWGSFSDI
jgi:hypothetical protein